MQKIETENPQHSAVSLSHKPGNLIIHKEPFSFYGLNLEKKNDVVHAQA